MPGREGCEHDGNFPRNIDQSSIAPGEGAPRYLTEHDRDDADSGPARGTALFRLPQRATYAANASLEFIVAGDGSGCGQSEWYLLSA